MQQDTSFFCEWDVSEIAQAAFDFDQRLVFPAGNCRTYAVRRQISGRNCQISFLVRDSCETCAGFCKVPAVVADHVLPSPKPSGAKRVLVAARTILTKRLSGKGPCAAATGRRLRTSDAPVGLALAKSEGST